MDLIGLSPSLPGMGETRIGGSFRTAPGGKGSNQAVQCARLGAEVVMAGCVGNDPFGQALLQAHIDDGIGISHVKVDKDAPTGVALIEVEQTKQDSQNRILVLPGANARLLPEDLSWLKEEISAFDMLMLQLEIPMETNAFAAAIAHEAGVPVMLNPAPAAELSPELLSHITWLSPNETEAAVLAGVQFALEGEEEIRAAADELLKRGVKKLIITLGERGSVLADGEGLIKIDPVSVERAVDPTAAGDSFVAAFCTGLTAGMAEKEALDFASHAAALTVCKEGALPSLPSLTQVRELMREKK